MKYAEFSALVGETIINISRNEDGYDNNEEMRFECASGKTYWMGHYQDCCESFCLSEIIGDLEDIKNSPVLLAEEVASDDDDGETAPPEGYTPESFTWTFYKISTIKGSVTLRWLGESNGYYSESADFGLVD